MLDDHREAAAAAAAAASNPINDDDSDDATEVREIHALTSTSPLQQHHPSSSSSSSSGRARRRDQSWELTSYRSPNLSLGSDVENFTTMSREFNALVVAGTTMQEPADTTTSGAGTDTATNLGRIGEDELLEETNPLAIVPDSNPIPSPRRASSIGGLPAGSASSSVDNSTSTSSGMAEVSVHQVKKEEVESKIGAWQTAEIAKINNRFKREDVVINGWESEQVEKAAARLKKVERKLDERRARAVEKMQNDVAKARRKAEEKRASAEAKRGTKVAKVLELSNLLRAVGRAPSKRSFF